MSCGDKASLVQSSGADSPLAYFYKAAGKSPPVLELLEADALPQPYRRLLDHDHDMTPVLEAFYGQAMSLHVFEKQLDDAALLRRVVLMGDADRKPVEFGAIRIHLDQFDHPAQQLIMGGHLPLGTILERLSIEHASHLVGLFRVRCDTMIKHALSCTGDQWLYGRHNRLVYVEGRMMAEAFEILPTICQSADKD